ncbi:MAG: amidohydrolase family protein [Myxococcota bacterium]|nr:amidohydrolase family protein [Myxococcota bacterium]
MLIRRAEVGGQCVDLRIAAGRIAARAPVLEPRPEERVWDAAGGALLPGLHDHHLHLFAWAAAQGSVRCGPPEVRDLAGLARALAEAGDGEWIRGVGYHESVAGRLDRDALDRLAPGRRVRVQHRSGALWMLSSPAVESLGLDAAPTPAGVERDAAGRASGRVFGLDAWLRRRLGATATPSLAAVGRALARFGVTGVTDATPHNGAAELEAFVAALRAGELPQRLVVMGGERLPHPASGRAARGARKIWLREAELPALAELEGWIRAAHGEGRPVAVHCTTRVELLLTLAAFASAGARPGDRLEHASVAPPEAVAQVAALPLTVVTQPHFIEERGDAYRREVEPIDRPWLYRCRAWLEAGVPLAAGTDAPFGDPDPWRAMRAARERRTAAGAVLGDQEALAPEQALALFTGAPEAPGGAPRSLGVGAPADLCLLDRPWQAARRDLESRAVAATWIGGELSWSALGPPRDGPSC